MASETPFAVWARARFNLGEEVWAKSCMNVGQVSRQGSDEEEALMMSTDVDKKSHNLNPPIYKACKFGQVNKA